MKIKLKDGWELDCIILKKNGEKVIYQYDDIEDILVKIVEVKEEELKELFSSSASPDVVLRESPNKPSSLTSRLSKDELKKHIHIKNHKVSLDQIKKIKAMIEEGMTDKDIAKFLDISPQLVHYWRKNTPKELV
jgi:hypothetical protein